MTLMTNLILVHETEDAAHYAENSERYRRGLRKIG